MSEGRFDLSTFRSERTNEASTLTIMPKRSSSRDVGSRFLYKATSAGGVGWSTLPVGFPFEAPCAPEPPCPTLCFGSRFLFEACPTLCFDSCMKPVPRCVSGLDQSSTENNHV
ncbi:hypothetical protein TNCV_834621 [Trichonephila clavipes]|nr:hypothetical protein TNCV_834621 [Trichonephila clavipes]